MVEKEVARFLSQQVPGRAERHASAACTQSISGKKAHNYTGVAFFHIQTTTGETFDLALSGALRSVLEDLSANDRVGYRPPPCLGLNWPVYLNALRQFGVEIACRKTSNTNDNDDAWGKYILLSEVRQESDAS